MLRNKFSAVIATDQSNAYNNLNRAVFSQIMAKLHDSFRQQNQYWSTVFEFPGVVHIQDSEGITHKVTMEEGTGQGDNCSPQAFVLYGDAVLEPLRQEGERHGVLYLSVMDDVLILVKDVRKIDVEQLIRDFNQRFKEYDLSTNVNKF